MSSFTVEALKHKLRKEADQQPENITLQNPAPRPPAGTLNLLGQAAKQTGGKMFNAAKQIPANAVGYWKDQWSDVGSNLKDTWSNLKEDPMGTAKNLGSAAKNFSYADYQNKLHQDPRWQDALTAATTPLALANPMLGGAMSGAAYGVATADPTSVALNAASAIPAAKYIGAAGKLLPSIAGAAKYIPHAAYTYESFRPESGVGVGQAAVNAAMSMAGAKNPILNPVGRIASNPIANPLIGQKLNRDINSWVYDDAAQAIPSQTVSAQ